MAETNGVNGHSDGPKFALKDVPVENLRPLRVVVIGAGFSGICAAIRCVTGNKAVYGIGFGLHGGEGYPRDSGTWT